MSIDDVDRDAYYRRKAAERARTWVDEAVRLSDPSVGTVSTNTTDDPYADAKQASADAIRRFDTGATRNVDAGKPDYEGFLSPAVLVEFGKYMNAHRLQADGTIREGDNWQKGIPIDSYMSSMWRHFMDVWLHHRGIDPESGVSHMEALMALLFNVQGYAFEMLQETEPGTS